MQTAHQKQANGAMIHKGLVAKEENERRIERKESYISAIRLKREAENDSAHHTAEEALKAFHKRTYNELPGSEEKKKAKDLETRYLKISLFLHVIRMFKIFA